MNLHYPVPEHTSHSTLWLKAAALLLVSLLLALRAAGQPVLVKPDHLGNFSNIQSLPRPLPVPEPPQGQPAPYPQASATPAPPAAQPVPVPQPIPIPPAGQ